MAKDKWLVPERDEWDIAVDSLMTTAFMAVALMVVIPMLPVARSAQAYFASQVFQGDVETRVLSATSTLQYWDPVNQSPYTPLVSVFLINRGTSRVFVAINAARDWLEIWPGETRTISHIGASKRIETLFYKCEPGNTAILEAEGHF